MYCEKCNRVFEADRCPVCRRSRVREPEAKDPCFLAEEDYLRSGMLADVLQQHGIPFLKKEVMGAGMAIKVGPMLDRSRFYVPYEQLENARAVADDLFAVAEPDTENDPEP